MGNCYEREMKLSDLTETLSHRRMGKTRTRIIYLLGAAALLVAILYAFGMWSHPAAQASTEIGAAREEKFNLLHKVQMRTTNDKRRTGDPSNELPVEAMAKGYEIPDNGDAMSNDDDELSEPEDAYEEAAHADAQRQREDEAWDEVP